MNYAAKLSLCALTLVLGSSLAVPTMADNYNRRVLLSNQSSRDIVEFYGSNTGTTEWQEDILGVDALASGEEVDINFDDNTGYCMFDFLIKFSDGSETTEERFNVCDYGTLTVQD